MSPLATRPTDASQPPEPAQALPLPDAHHRLLAPERQAAAWPTATDDFALAVLVQRVVRSRVPDRTATLSRQPQSTESLEADDHTIEPYRALGRARLPS